MKKSIILTILVSTITGIVSGQQNIDTAVNRQPASPAHQSSSQPHHSPFAINPAVDIPILSGAAAWDVYGFSQISKKASSSQAEVMNLKTSDIDWLDR